MRREASDAANRLDTALRAEAGRQQIRDWLTRFGVLCAGRMPVEEAKVKIAGYTTDLLHLPAGLFTDASRRTIAGTMQWFPSYGELLTALNLEHNRLKLQLLRLQRIAEAPAAPLPHLRAVPQRDPVTTPVMRPPPKPKQDQDQIASEQLSRDQREKFWRDKLGLG